MILFPTTRFLQNAKRFDCEEIVGELTQAVSPYSAKALLTQRVFFEPLGPYLKRRVRDHRIVAQLTKVDAYEVLVLLDLFRRDDGTYNEIIADPRDKGPEYLNGLYDSEDIENWIAATDEEGSVTIELEPLPESLTRWLDAPGWGTGSSEDVLIVYESEEWVKRFQTNEILNKWHDYHQLVLNILDSSAKESSAVLKTVSNGSRAITYCNLSLRDDSRDLTKRILFLLSPFDPPPTPEQLTELQKEFTFLPRVDGELCKIEEVLPFGRRSYPDFMLGDSDVWFEIEKEREANLALSGEEELLLESLSSPELGKSALPVFINGRAGSGKSTMLYYLFSDYCYRSLAERKTADNGAEIKYEPVFLTYNDRLVSVARKATHAILKSHHEYLTKGSFGGKEISIIDHYFSPFQDFLLKLLPEDQRVRFDKRQHVSFQKFKEAYQGRDSKSRSIKTNPRGSNLPSELPTWRGPREYSSELCWYVIRTFIKGYAPEGYLSTDDYMEEVPRRERVVAKDAFEWVHNQIWTHWYRTKLEEGGFWDDQDLIRAVLKLDSLPTFTAIFCDEAQDFTRSELQLIMRLSVFSKFDLGDHPIQCLPFAFAGDSFQTLNPTGFRWSNTQAAFHEKVLAALDPLQRLHLEINFQELTFNYRSSAPIVKANNLIQLWRRVLFDHKELQPQRWWWQQREAREALWFIFGENADANDFLRNAQNTIIIVPCEEGSVTQYVQNDDALRQLLSEVSAGTRTSQEGVATAPQVGALPNVLTAVESKGLEFDKVVLYKFGEFCPDRGLDVYRDSQVDQISGEYFFNKLYVAASRARHDLFIVDSKDGYDRLWRFAEPTQIDGFLNRTRNQGRWRDHVGGLRRGNREDWEILSQTDPVSVATEFEENGMRDQNAEWLRRAELFYRSVSKKDEANRCAAWAFKYEGDLIDAGRMFEKMRNDAEAVECYWDGMHWRELMALSSRHALSEERQGLVTFMSSDAREFERIPQFRQLLGDALSRSHTHISLSRQWQEAIEELANRCNRTKPERFNSAQWVQLGAVLEASHAALGEKRLLLVAGECSYRGRNFGNAIRQWDLADKNHPDESPNATQRREYNLAQAAIQPFPEKLRWLQLAREFDRIVEEWEGAGGYSGVRIPAESLDIVGRAFEERKDLRSALRVYENTDNFELIQGFIDRMSEDLKKGERLLIGDEKDKISPEREASLQLTRQCWDIAFPVFVDSAIRWSKWSVVNAHIKNLVPSVLNDEQAWDALQVYVEFLVDSANWSEVLEMIETRIPDMSRFERKLDPLRFKVVQEFAYSQIQGQRLSRKERDKYLALVQHVEQSDWKKHLSIREMGAAIERGGEYAATLGFYEQYWDSSDLRVKSFARERWLANKKRAVRGRGGSEFMEIHEKARLWGLDPAVDFPEFPILQRDTVTGLPHATRLEQPSEGVFHFQLENWEVRINIRSKLVLVTDTEDFKTLRIDGGQHTVVGLDDIHLSRDQSSGSVSFFAPQNSLRGAVFPHGNSSRVKLQFDSATIAVEM